MEGQLKIGIVEDDLIIAESLYSSLNQIGYSPLRPVRNYEDAIRMIEKENPDLLILDITIDGDKDGVDIAERVNNEFKTPFIFLTAYSDDKTIERTKKVNPFAYLVKPYNENNLYSAIETAINNYQSQKTNNENASKADKFKGFLLIKDGHLYHKIKCSDILYVESENVYLTVYTDRKQFVIREKLIDFIDGNPESAFIRVHRSFAVNIQHLEALNEFNVIIGNHQIPIQKKYRNELLESIKLFK